MGGSRSYCKGRSPQCGAVGDTAGGGSPQHGAVGHTAGGGSPQGGAVGDTAGGVVPSVEQEGVVPRVEH